MAASSDLNLPLSYHMRRANLLFGKAYLSREDHLPDEHQLLLDFETVVGKTIPAHPSFRQRAEAGDPALIALAEKLGQVRSWLQEYAGQGEPPEAPKTEQAEDQGEGEPRGFSNLMDFEMELSCFEVKEAEAKVEQSEVLKGSQEVADESSSEEKLPSPRTVNRQRRQISKAASRRNSFLSTIASVASSRRSSYSNGNDFSMTGLSQALNQIVSAAPPAAEPLEIPQSASPAKRSPRASQQLSPMRRSRTAISRTLLPEEEVPLPSWMVDENKQVAEKLQQVAESRAQVAEKAAQVSERRSHVVEKGSPVGERGPQVRKARKSIKELVRQASLPVVSLQPDVTGSRRVSWKEEPQDVAVSTATGEATSGSTKGSEGQTPDPLKSKAKRNSWLMRAQTYAFGEATSLTADYDTDVSVGPRPLKATPGRLSPVRLSGNGLLDSPKGQSIKRGRFEVTDDESDDSSFDEGIRVVVETAVEDGVVKSTISRPVSMAKVPLPEKEFKATEKQKVIPKVLRKSLSRKERMLSKREADTGDEKMVQRLTVMVEEMVKTAVGEIQQAIGVEITKFWDELVGLKKEVQKAGGQERLEVLVKGMVAQGREVMKQEVVEISRVQVTEACAAVKEEVARSLDEREESVLVGARLAAQEVVGPMVDRVRRDALTARLETERLTEVVNLLSAEASATSARLRGLESGVEETAMTMNELAGRVDATSAEVVATSARVEALSADLPAMSATHAATSARVEALSVTTVATSASLEALSSWSNAMSARLEALSAAADATSAKAYASSAAEGPACLEAMSARLDAMSAQLEATSADLLARVEKVEGSLEKPDHEPEETAALEWPEVLDTQWPARLSETEERLTALYKSLESEVAKRSAEVESKQAKVLADISSLKEGYENARQELLNAKQAQDEALREALSAETQPVAGHLEQAVAEATETLCATWQGEVKDTWSRSLDALERRLQGQLEGICNLVDSHKQQVANLQQVAAGLPQLAGRCSEVEVLGGEVLGCLTAGVGPLASSVEQLKAEVERIDPKSLERTRRQVADIQESVSCIRVHMQALQEVLSKLQNGGGVEHARWQALQEEIEDLRADLVEMRTAQQSCAKSDPLLEHSWSPKVRLEAQISRRSEEEGGAPPDLELTLGGPNLRTLEENRQSVERLSVDDLGFARSQEGQAAGGAIAGLERRVEVVEVRMDRLACNEASVAAESAGACACLRQDLATLERQLASAVEHACQEADEIRGSLEGRVRALEWRLQQADQEAGNPLVLTAREMEIQEQMAACQALASTANEVASLAESKCGALALELVRLVKTVNNLKKASNVESASAVSDSRHSSPVKAVTPAQGETLIPRAPASLIRKHLPRVQAYSPGKSRSEALRPSHVPNKANEAARIRGTPGQYVTELPTRGPVTGRAIKGAQLGMVKMRVEKGSKRTEVTTAKVEADLALL